jgi:hypothetical protein
MGPSAHDLPENVRWAPEKNPSLKVLTVAMLMRGDGCYLNVPRPSFSDRAFCLTLRAAVPPCEPAFLCAPYPFIFLASAPALCQNVAR